MRAFIIFKYYSHQNLKNCLKVDCAFHLALQILHLLDQSEYRKFWRLYSDWLNMLRGLLQRLHVPLSRGTIGHEEAETSGSDNIRIGKPTKR